MGLPFTHGYGARNVTSLNRLYIAAFFRRNRPFFFIGDVYCTIDVREGMASFTSLALMVFELLRMFGREASHQSMMWSPVFLW